MCVTRLLRRNKFNLLVYGHNSKKNQTAGRPYIYGRGLENIYLNRRKKKMFMVFIRYITYYSLIFLVHKQVYKSIVCIGSFTLDWNLGKSAYILGWLPLHIKTKF